MKKKPKHKWKHNYGTGDGALCRRSDHFVQVYDEKLENGVPQEDLKNVSTALFYAHCDDIKCKI